MVAAPGTVTRWIAVVWRSCNGFMTKGTLEHHPGRVQSLLGEAQHVGEALRKATSVSRLGYLQHRTRPGYLGCFYPSPNSRDVDKRSSRKPVRPFYAAACMSIRPTLQAAASPSDGSTDLAGPERNYTTTWFSTGLPSTSLRTTGGEAPSVGGEFVAR
jgi:hypothetical protein